MSSIPQTSFIDSTDERRIQIKQSWIDKLSETYRCVECNRIFNPYKSLEGFPCKTHTLPLNLKLMYQCCGKARGSLGCTPCIHHDTKPFNFEFRIVVPLFLFEGGFIDISKIDSARIFDGKTFYLKRNRSVISSTNNPLVDQGIDSRPSIIPLVPDETRSETSVIGFFDPQNEGLMQIVRKQKTFETSRELLHMNETEKTDTIFSYVYVGIIHHND